MMAWFCKMRNAQTHVGINVSKRKMHMLGLMFLKEKCGKSKGPEESLQNEELLRVWIHLILW